MGAHVIEDLTGIVLAGGQARRMGHVNKALLTVGGETVLDRILARLRDICSHVVIVANDPEPYWEYGIPVVPDVMPGHGALGGLHAGLMNAPTEKVFACACDMPFISPALIRRLSAMLEGADAAVPQDSYGLQPLHAVYARRIAPRIVPMLERGDLKLSRLVEAVDARILPPDQTASYAAEAEIFFNVNTPADLEQARTAAGRL